MDLTPVSFRSSVSIHVLRRGRCVLPHFGHFLEPLLFQSTSSEEDVVSYTEKTARSHIITFQSTSSEEDVVSRHGVPLHTLNPFQSTSSEEDVVSRITTRPTPRLQFQSTSSEEDVVSVTCSISTAQFVVSIHVLRRGRCVHVNFCASITRV